ncbi:efflux RND transporter periplasmic adaptor subunit [Phycisphaerales bacterium AB-hyl4]|uniref:Efflux RND transporter periplasmic adaptor subunit n=1 Tax=Natronomicrosphaera hydrolytica TaxID=3242702 RepID=A0ABV4U900_9BACT
MPENTNQKSNRPKRKWRLALAVLIVLLIPAVAAATWFGALRSDDDTLRIPTFTVEQGPMTISVSESGTIAARDQVILSSEVEGQNTLIYLIEEGEQVEEGDLLAELDASRFEEQRVSQQISVQNAEASLIRARENLAVTESQGQSDVEVAELAYDFAQLDLNKYIEGEYPKQMEEIQSRIMLAEQELTQAQDRLSWSERLFEEQYISQNERDSDRLTVERRELDVRLARADLDLLEAFAHDRKLRELQSDVDQKRASLERTKRRASADNVQAQAELRARQLEYAQQNDRLAQIEDQIAKCEIVAPRSGMVVYATSAQAGRRGNQEPLEAGQSIRQRQELIYLPQSGSMRVEVKVHESSLDKVRIGQPVRVSVDALPGRTYTGRVTRIAPLPDAQSIWLNPDLTVYSTTIALDDTGGELRTGMTCRAEIIVDQYDNAVYVPVQSVVRVGELPVVYLPTREGPMAVPVEIGLDNNRMVRIIDGIEPGQRVMLAPPLSPDRETVARLASLQPQPGEPTTSEEAAITLAQAPESESRSDDDDSEQRRGQRRGGEGMSDEQRQQMRERLEQMSPEEREQAMQQRRQRRELRQPQDD